MDAEDADQWVMDLSYARLLELSGSLLPAAGAKPDALTLARQRAADGGEQLAAEAALREAMVKYLEDHRSLDYNLNSTLLDRRIYAGMPAFTCYGCLPPGRYQINWSDLHSQLGFNETRRRLIETLESAKSLLSQIAETIWLGGSFVTLKPEPDDIDLLWPAVNGVTGEATIGRLPAAIDGWWDEAWKLRLLQNTTIWRGGLPDKSELSEDQRRMLPRFRAVGLIELPCNRD